MQQISKTSIIKENRILRKYVDVLEQELKQGTLENNEISLFDERMIFDKSCYKKCGGIFEYIPEGLRPYHQKDHSWKCNKCERTTNGKKFKYLGEQKTLRKNPLTSIQDMIEFSKKEKLESVDYFRQILAKIYRAITDEITEQETTENLEKVKEIREKIFDEYFGISQDLSKVRLMSLITTDGKIEQIGESDYKLTRTKRTKKIDEIKYDQIGIKSNIELMIKNQFSKENLLNIINIPEQKIKKNFEKSETELKQKIIRSDVRIDEKSQELRSNLNYKKKLAEWKEQNKQQRIQHEQELKTNPVYAISHSKAHKPFCDEDRETRNPEVFDYDRFGKSDHDRFYLPIIKTKHWSYTETGMINRHTLLNNYFKLQKIE